MKVNSANIDYHSALVTSQITTFATLGAPHVAPESLPQVSSSVYDLDHGARNGASFRPTSDLFIGEALYTCICRPTRKEKIAIQSLNGDLI